MDALLNEAFEPAAECDDVPCAALMGKRCTKCGLFKSLNEFSNDKARAHLDGKQAQCKPCKGIGRRLWYNSLPNRLEWRRAHEGTREQVRAHRQRRRKKTWNLRLEMIAAYGGCCSCCGITEPEFLTLEHLNGGGRAHKRLRHRAAAIYQDLKDLGWPKEYTCLCFNCNSARGHYGVCPHVGSPKH